MRIVEGPASVADDRWIVGLNRPDEGVVAAAARPGSDAFWSIGAAIHGALRQQAPVLTTSERDRRLLTTWIEAYRVRDVVIHHAERYPASVLHDVERLLREAGARLWVVVGATVHELVVRDVAALGRVDTMPWSAFRDTWAPFAATPRVVADGVAARLDPVAAWGSQYERLARAATRGMDLPYLAGFCSAAGWTRSDRPAKVDVAAKVRACLGRYEDAECFVQAARGVAVALHEIGWQVTIDLAAAARASAGTALARPDDVVRLGAIRQFRDPLTASAIGLASLELSRPEILALEIGDVSVDGDVLSLWHDRLEVPAVLQPIIRALRIWRTADGAIETDRLIGLGSKGLSTRHFVNLALAGFEELGRAVTRTELDERPAADERWLLERGIALGWVSRLDRRSIGPSGMTGHATLAAVVGVLERPERIPTRPTCRCGEPHGVPVPPEPGVWPPVRPHVPPRADHRWRR